MAIEKRNEHCRNNGEKWREDSTLERRESKGSRTVELLGCNFQYTQVTAEEGALEPFL